MLVLVLMELEDLEADDLELGAETGLPDVHADEVHDEFKLAATFDGVLDVLQMPAFGKKGRIAAQIQILARENARESVIAACFSETTTLGLRWKVTRRAFLQREEVGDVKLVIRPGGQKTAKAEMDSLAEDRYGHAGRIARRQRQEDAALDKDDKND